MFKFQPKWLLLYRGDFLYVQGLFNAPGLTCGKKYKVKSVESLSKIWSRKYLIQDDLKEMTWCYDDEVIELVF